ncbi:MAG: hypothetical protein KDE27_07055 [Planctomycetes bacterium]|nr:hypothetical protein [Planctomycetota bacterium]
MKTPTEVDFRIVAGAADMADARSAEPIGAGGYGAAAQNLAASRPAATANRQRHGDERLSFDPLRATDRYRLVTPIDLHL